MARLISKSILASMVLLLAACNGSEIAVDRAAPGDGTEDANDKSIADIGIEYAMSTKQLLGKNLIGTIDAEGSEAAVRFCNEQALPLTSQMATQYNAQIRRVSDRPRNPANAANVAELRYIEQFKTAVAKGEPITPVVVSEGTRHDFYYPITTNAMCLQCHGPVDKIEPAALAALRALYPDDEAVGYGSNDVRGIWSIQFEK